MIGGGGSDDIFNSLVIMVGVWCLCFFSFRVVRESVVRRKGLMGTAFLYMGQ